MGKIVIVDGSNLLFQMFYGMPARIVNRQGKAIQGTIGFVGALLKIVRSLEPTHLAVVFDGEGENVRCEMDEAYKSNRTDYSELPEEEVPFSQLPDIYDALDYLQICHSETKNCEADDWIAGYALKYGHEHEMVVVSQDSDFFQLISKTVRVLRYRGKNSVLCDSDYLQEKYGISPKQYADFKSLTGDTADNIKGADKIGPKTAAQLLKEYGSLEGILAGAERIHKPSVRESVLRDTKRLRLNYRLIQLDGTEDLPFSLEEMAYQCTEETSTEVLRKIGVLP